MPPEHNLARGTAASTSLARTGVLSLLTGLLALSSLAACGSNDTHTQTGPAPSTSPASSTPTPAATTARQRAVTAAIAQVNRYEHMLDELGIHPTMSLDKLYTVATEPEVLDQIAFFNHFRSAHDRQAGRVQVLSIDVGHVALAHDARGSSSQRPTIDVTACLDVTHVQAFGAGGRSIVPKNRKPYYVARVRVVNVKYPDLSFWRVAKVRTTEEEDSCAS